jgi:pimeloyl-ACP methyl ester carboxylesterase
MTRIFAACVLLAGLTGCGRKDEPMKTGDRHVIFLHGRIVEEKGRRPTDSVFGVYEYDAILDSLRARNLTVISEQRRPGIPIDSSATRLIEQIDSLQKAGVRPEAITVAGFSRGGAIALLASSRLNNPAISWVIIGACGDWVFERQDVRLSGHILSLYEKSDSLGVSCAPLFERRAAGAETEEIALELGLGHGTFYQPRPEWVLPVVAWAGRSPLSFRGREPEARD